MGRHREQPAVAPRPPAGGFRQPCLRPVYSVRAAIFGKRHIGRDEKKKSAVIGDFREGGRRRKPVRGPEMAVDQTGTRREPGREAERVRRPARIGQNEKRGQMQYRPVAIPLRQTCHPASRVIRRRHV